MLDRRELCVISLSSLPVGEVRYAMNAEELRLRALAAWLAHQVCCRRVDRRCAAVAPRGDELRVRHPAQARAALRAEREPVLRLARVAFVASV